MGLWEKLYNPDFKPIEFERFRREAGSNYFVLSPQRWIENTNATGIISKSGRYGGTFAHNDIAFEFASWISSEFKLYLITEFKRLKQEENNRLQLEWNLQRTISKINYKIHTDAIKEILIPKEITKLQTSIVYANEADLLNVALFDHIWIGHFLSEEDFENYLDQTSYCEAWNRYNNEPLKEGEEDVEPDSKVSCKFCQEIGKVD